MSDIPHALRRAREAVSAHISLMDDAGLTWGEETATEIYLANCHPEIRGATFTRHEEARLGADWLWWWLDDTGEAFGMLVQAKRIHGSGDGATFDLAHSNRHGLQVELLRSAAATLEVAPVFALYTGLPRTRAGLPCSCFHDAPDCAACASATVDLVAEIAVRNEHGSTVPAERILRKAIPAEYVTRSDTPRSEALWLASQIVANGELRAFLTTRQVGARAVARHVFDAVAAVRAGQFALAEARLVPERVTAARVFQALPDDRGHWGEAYFENVLRGLRHAPPAYVLAVEHGKPVRELLPANVAGIAIFQVNNMPEDTPQRDSPVA